MIVGAVRESYPGENRVAITRSETDHLTDIGVDVLLESGAGREAGFSDKEYESSGADVLSAREDVFEQSDVLLQVRGLAANPEHYEKDLEMAHEGQILVGMMNPHEADEALDRAADANLTVVAMELIPRISRAQSMDVLSSQANLGGYQSVLLGAEDCPKVFPMMMTAAGTIQPARVFVIGAGVAGLQAVATAERLGAQVKGYDIRLEVKEQVESLGAEFVELDLETEDAEGESGYAREMDETFYEEQRRKMAEVLAEIDVCITTAAIPGQEAPLLVNKNALEGMPSGAQVVDLAAPTGGNCEVTEPGETVNYEGVTVKGPLNLPATVPYNASNLYANNLTSFLTSILEDGELHFDREDEVIASTLLLEDGERLNTEF
jgi:NAD(P) transhydrogenase subunit alpha